MNHIFAIQRAEIFSPNSVNRDHAILKRVADRTGAQIIKEEDLTEDTLQGAALIYTMGRSETTLDLLQKKEEEGVRVLNPSEGLRQCRRSLLEKTMREYHLPVPPPTGEHGWWLKRGDSSATEKGDVVYCKDETELLRQRKSFAARGIKDIICQAHIPGDIIKFYCVRNRMFRYFYPGDSSYSKFGDENINGAPHHYPFDEEGLRNDIFRLSEIVNVPICGGDAIVSPEGNYYIIDFNDWPSFARCREEAADAIVSL